MASRFRKLSRSNLPLLLRKQTQIQTIQRHRATSTTAKRSVNSARVHRVCSFLRTDRKNTQDRSTIQIGFFGDLTGPTFNFGLSAKNGVLMAADEINQAGGINGHQLDVVIEDDKGSPEEAAQSAGKLIDRYKVVAIIGAGASGNSLAAAPKAQAAHVPLIAPSSTNPAVTQSGDYIFRACFIDAFQGEVMAKFAAQTLKAKKAAILLDFNSPYSRGLTEFFELSFAKLEGHIVVKQSYSQGDADYRGQLSAIKAADPDVIYIPGYYGDVAIIAKQARQLGLTIPLLGADGWDAPELWELGGDALNGSYISNHYSAEDPAETIQKFVQAYRQRYGNLTPDAHAALAYDALRFLAEAIQKAGTTEGPKLRRRAGGNQRLCRRDRNNQHGPGTQRRETSRCPTTSGRAIHLPGNHSTGNYSDEKINSLNVSADFTDCKFLSKAVVNRFPSLGSA